MTLGPLNRLDFCTTINSITQKWDRIQHKNNNIIKQKQYSVLSIILSISFKKVSTRMATVEEWLGNIACTEGFPSTSSSSVAPRLGFQTPLSTENQQTRERLC